jgi:hypothetical protein
MDAKSDADATVSRTAAVSVNPVDVVSAATGGKTASQISLPATSAIAHTAIF